jgi:hypothetical protein
MAAITFYHEVFGSTGEARHELQTLDLDVSTISVADLIRLRVETAYEAEDAGPEADRYWNAAATAELPASGKISAAKSSPAPCPLWASATA